MKKSKVKFIIKKALEEEYGKLGLTNTAHKLTKRIFNKLDNHTKIKVINTKEHKAWIKHLKEQP